MLNYYILLFCTIISSVLVCSSLLLWAQQSKPAITCEYTLRKQETCLYREQMGCNMYRIGDRNPLSSNCRRKCTRLHNHGRLTF